MGKGDSHRSGFQSSASSPHISGLQFDAMMPTIMFVLLGTGISLISLPSTPRMGFDKGRMISLRVLHATMFRVHPGGLNQTRTSGSRKEEEDNYDI
jgi:hypothetical protein